MTPTRPQRTPPNTWKSIRTADSFAIRNLVVRVGGEADRELRGDQEIWRVRLGDAVFTGYGTGTIYCSGGSAPELAFLYEKIGVLGSPPAPTHGASG